VTPEIREAIAKVDDVKVRHALQLLDAATVRETATLEKRLSRENRWRLTAFVVIVVLSIVGFISIENNSNKQHDETTRAVAAECRIARTNRLALVKILQRPRTPLMIPADATETERNLINQANIAADKARADALKSLGRPVHCGGKPPVREDTTTPPPTVAPLPLTLPTAPPSPTIPNQPGSG
jgi:hypothetical protein